jgi:hypothetical protein
MRSLITLGVVSLVGVAGMIACGDDDSGDGPSNTAGTGGTSSGGGTGGTAGNSVGGGGNGGTAGNAVGGGGAGGAAPLPPPPAAGTCTGCIELVVPAVGPNDGSSDGTAVNQADQAIFQFNLTPVADFSDAVVTWRVAAVEPNANHVFQLFVQNGQAQNFAGAYYAFSLTPDAFPANTFREISIDISALAGLPGDAGVVDAGAPPAPVVDAGADAGDAGGPAPVTPFIAAGFDKSQIAAYGVIVGVGNAAPAGVSVVRLQLDDVVVENVAGQNHNFNASAEGFVLNTYQAPPSTPAPYSRPAP